MKINAINVQDNSYKKTSFKAHPDFKKLAKNYDIKASSYFRRGRLYGSASYAFEDVIFCLRDIFYKKAPELRNMLVAGIGDSQEPFSFLAVIKCMLQKEALKDNLDLHIVDLQSKPTKEKLFKQSFLDDIKPRYVSDSFVRDEGINYGFKDWMHYRVNDEIFDFLRKTYNNPKKSHWESRIQEVIKDMPNEKFDIVSCNNTLGYINDEPVIHETIEKIIRTLKKGGVFITDSDSKYNEVCKNKTFEIYNGIFQKY